MKSFLWNWCFKRGTLVVLGALSLQSDSLAPSMPSVETLNYIKQSVITFYEGAGKEYRQAEGNLGVLNLALTQMYFREYRFPSSYQELVNSPYMVVLPEDFVNPYTGSFVQENSGEPAAGDVKFISTPEEVYVTMFLNAPPVELPEGVGIQGLGISPGISQGTLVQRRTINVVELAEDPTRKESEKWRKFTIEQSSRWPPERKRFITFCRGISELMNNASFLYGIRAMNWNWEEFLRRMEWHLNLRVRNPYTGEWIKPVDPRNPSPGNFSVIYKWREDSFGNLRVHTSCTVYDSKGKPIFDPRLTSMLEKNPEFRVLH